jgi:hypothetical protein
MQRVDMYKIDFIWGTTGMMPVCHIDIVLGVGVSFLQLVLHEVLF